MNEYEQQRREHARKLTDLGIDPRGRAVITRSPADVRRWCEAPNSGVILDANGGSEATVNGRIVLKRDMGNLSFVTLRESGADIQIAFSKKRVDATVWIAQKLLDLGDHIAVSGNMGRTNTGELTCWVNRVESVTKSLRTPPSKVEGMTDVEARYRQRYADLYSNPDSMRALQTRFHLTRVLRRELSDDQFVEVETPILQAVAGGAAAKPFKTHHNALGLDLSLRIAPELFLKRLMVGGMPRLYEIGRNFRNEGISTKHNPEFTVVEAYEAYGDYRSMMDLVEQVVKTAVQEITGGLQVKQHDGRVIDFSQWRRVPLNVLLHEYMDRSTMVPADAMMCYERNIEPELIQPTFVTHFPADHVPLCKVAADQKDASMEGWGFGQVAENFELVIGGMEIGPGYTEQNDPDAQLAVMERQLADRGPDTPDIDRDFIEALMHGMPPAGGVGLGIDRLAMLLAGAVNVREVMAFPFVKPV